MENEVRNKKVESKQDYTSRLKAEREQRKKRKEKLLIDLCENDSEFFELFYKIAEKRLDGIARYGKRSFNDLGTKGIFVDINRKHTRLKRHFWEEKIIGSEKIEDSMLDNIVYIMLLFKAYLGSMK